MLVTFNVISVKARLLLTLKTSTDFRLLIPSNELSPVLVISTLEAFVIPTVPKLSCCSEASAVKLTWVAVVSLGNESTANAFRA